jgi:heptosyltransferase-2
MKTKLSKQKIIDKYAGTLINNLISLIKTKAKVNKPKVIIIYKLDAIGDSILCLPMIKHLKEQTHVKIIIACSNSNIDVFKHHKFIDKIVVFDSSSFNPINFTTNIKELRKEEADIAIDGAQSANISAILSWLTAKNSFGFKKTNGMSRNKVYTYPINLDPNKHMAYNYMDLLKPLRIKLKRDIKLIPLYTKKIIKENIVGVHPCNILPYKAWPQNRWVEIIEYLALKNEVIVVGSKEESFLVKELLKKVKSKQVLDLSGRINIEELISLMPRFKLFIGNDGGPMHIAASVGVPVIGLFGPETPIRYKPFISKSISLYKPINCSPCIKSYADQTPNCQNNICMKNITIQDVKKAIDKLLK